MKQLRYISDLLLKNKYKYLLGILFLLSVDVLQLILPRVIGNVADLLDSGKPQSAQLLKYAVSIALLAVGVAVFRFLFRYVLFGVARSVELSFRNRFYAHLQKLSMNYFNLHKTGDLMAHATNDMNNVTMAAGQGIIFAVDSSLIPIAALVMMWITAGFRLTIACFLPLLALGISVVYFMKLMSSTVQKQQEAFSNMTEAARENFSGIRVIKAFVQEEKEIERFREANTINREANLKFVRLMSMLFPTVMSISGLSFVIALWYGGILVIRGELDLGGFIAFNSYLGMLIWPISAIGWVANMFQRGSVSLGRISTIMDEKPEITDETPADSDPSAFSAADPETASAASSDQPDTIGGSIEFRNLTFTYPGSDRPVLRDITITLEKGNTLGIVGRTGSGKTTLINLVPRLLSAPQGTLFIDGRDINSIPLPMLRDSIGCVPQDTILFSESIRDNIDFYRGFEMEEITEAAGVARIDDNIREFPGGYDTIVGERGITLSGGQKQRTAIARAVLGSPSVLILDDCLSAVDAHTEEEILRDLKRLMKQRTSIIVSHRISAVKDADRIIVLDDGAILQQGSHAELLEQEGYYRELYDRQLLADEIEGAE